MDVREVYRCRICKELWETEAAAAICCEHVDDLWQCAKCNKAYITQNEAELCCQ